MGKLYKRGLHLEYFTVGLATGLGNELNVRFLAGRPDSRIDHCGLSVQRRIQSLDRSERISRDRVKKTLGIDAKA